MKSKYGLEGQTLVLKISAAYQSTCLTIEPHRNYTKLEKPSVWAVKQLSPSVL